MFSPEIQPDPWCLGCPEVQLDQLFHDVLACPGLQGVLDMEVMFLIEILMIVIIMISL